MSDQTCTEGVTRKGEYETCGKTAVAHRIDPEEGMPYPVCAYHSRGDMVPLGPLTPKTALTAIAELDRHLTTWEQKHHTTVGIPFLRNHFALTPTPENQEQP